VPRSCGEARCAPPRYPASRAGLRGRLRRCGPAVAAAALSGADGGAADVVVAHPARRDRGAIWSRPLDRVAKRGHRLGAAGSKDGGKPRTHVRRRAGAVRPSAWSAVRSEASASWSIWDCELGPGEVLDMSPQQRVEGLLVAVGLLVMTDRGLRHRRTGSTRETWNGPEDDEMWAIPPMSKKSSRGNDDADGDQWPMARRPRANGASIQALRCDATAAAEGAAIGQADRRPGRAVSPVCNVPQATWHGNRRARPAVSGISATRPAGGQRARRLGAHCTGRLDGGRVDPGVTVAVGASEERRDGRTAEQVGHQARGRSNLVCAAR